MTYKILDCTLRDGGYYTDWSFDESLVKSLVRGLVDSNVDIIELGYKSPIKGGKFRKCNDGYLSSFLDKDLSNFCFMIDVKDYVIDNSLDLNLFNSSVGNSDFFKTCRVAFKQTQIDFVPQLVRSLKSKGYSVIVNIMGITDISKIDLNNICKRLSNLPLEAVYFADSYGNLEPSMVESIVDSLRSTGKKIGFHSHDNLGLAFANTLKCIDLGVEFIDATLTGMGRGVGNLKMEQLLMYGGSLNKTLINCIEDYLSPLQAKMGWGFSIPYMYAGINKVHPLIAQDVSSLSIPLSTKISMLEKSKGQMSYDPKKITEMKNDLTACVIIPARFKSSRFPGKPLAKINGKEMILHVCEKAELAVGKDNVYVATENRNIAKVVAESGFNYIMTSDSCLTGTDRVAEASLEIDYDIYVNLQGDEPMVNPEDIKKAIQEKKDNFSYVINCSSNLSHLEDVESNKIPKLVIDNNGVLIYASRGRIPFQKDGSTDSVNFLKQVCIYCYNKNELKSFASNTKTDLEFHEDIEILRFLEKGMKVKILNLNSFSLAVDFPEDILEVEKCLT